MCGYYVGAIMHNEHVANICIYIINKEVETLLSGPAAEALGILTFNIKDKNQPSLRRVVHHDKTTNYLLTKFKKCFTGVGKLIDYQVELHILFPGHIQNGGRSR